MEVQSLQDIAADFKAIAVAIQIDLADAGKLLVAARLFDRAMDLAGAGADKANRQAESLIFPVGGGRMTAGDPMPGARAARPGS